MKAKRGRRFSYPVWILLALVGLYPMIGLTSLVVEKSLAADEAADEAQRTRAEVEVAMQLEVLALFVASDANAEFALYSIEQLGLDLTLLLGEAEAERFEALVNNADQRIDSIVAALSFEDPAGSAAVLGENRRVVGEVVADLNRARAELDARKGTSQTVDVGALAAVYQQAISEARQASVELVAGANTTGGKSAFLRDLYAMQSMMLSMQASVEEAAAVSAMFGTIDPSVMSDGDPLEVIASAGAVRRHERGRFESLATALPIARWREFSTTPDGQKLHELRTQLSSIVLGGGRGGDGQGGDGQGRGGQGVGVQGFDVLTYTALMFDELDFAVEEALPAVRSAVFDALEAEEQAAVAAVQERLREAAVLMVVTVAVVTMAARLLLRPLRKTNRQAQALSAGDFDLEEVGQIGPQEISEVSEALGQAQRTFKLLMNQLAALADRQVDNPVLAQSVPGPMGGYVAQSVSALKEATAQLHTQARTDHLTGLPNRIAAVENLQIGVGMASRHSPIAAVFIDLDRFKAANDGFGHRAGDAILVSVARRFEAALADRPAFVGRLGGDEFLVVLPDCDAPGARRVAEQLIESLEDPIAVEGAKVVIGASAGYVIADSYELDALDLLHCADLALYKAKTMPGAIAECTTELRDEADRKRAIAVDLKRALGTTDLELHLQPLVDMDTGRIDAAEGLLRWTHQGEPMSPGVFIPIVESSGLIVDVGKWVLIEAAHHAAHLAGELGRIIPVSVNISWNHVESGALVGHVVDALKSAGIDGRHLRIELTETTPPRDMAAAAAALDEIRALGVELWLDDFGTGFTSITQLRELRFDAIKLDRSFVSEGSGPEAAAIADALIEIARLVDVDVIAEGVELQSEADRMNNSGCVLGQGWLWSRALRAAELIAMAQQHAGPPTSSARARSA